MMVAMISTIRSWLTSCFGYNQEDEQDHEMWTNQIPNDVLRFILHRLPRPEYLQLREVCPTWKTLIDTTSPASHQLLPWLLLDSNHLFFLKDGSFVSDHRKISTLVQRGQPRCVGSVQGWLIMHEYVNEYRYFFLNPISGGVRMFPSLPCMEKEKAVASSIPTRPKHCYVASLNLLSGRLAFCRLKDQSWTVIEAVDEAENALEFRDVEIAAGKLYAATSSALEFLMVFDINLSGAVPSYTTERLVVQHYNSVGGRTLNNRIYFPTWFLVKDSESHELFLVSRMADVEQVTKGFQVLKLEHCDSSCGGARWVEIGDLGSRVFFVSMVNNKCITSKGDDGGFDDKTLERSCIYFAFNWYSADTNVVEDFGVFSLTKKSVKPLNSPLDPVNRRLNQIVWFTPNPW